MAALPKDMFEMRFLKISAIDFMTWRLASDRCYGTRLAFARNRALSFPKLLATVLHIVQGI